MRLRRPAAAAAALLLCASPVLAAPGTTPFEFLSLDADARAVALGGAYTALASDANALLYNPGGLGLVPRSEAAFMHDEHFQGVHQEYASYADRRGWGAQLNYLSYGDIPKTTISNKDGAGLGSYGIQDLAVSGGYGRRLTPALAVGGALKYVREDIEDVSAQGTALDAGVLYASPALPGLRLGAALRNFGPDVKFQTEAEKLPLQLRGGAAYAANLFGQRGSLSVDVLKSRGEAPTVAAGVETVLAGLMALRLGYDMRNDAGLGLTAGVGWRTRAFDI
ncbi:MAG: PorV/PorQ family protein, partial [Elusimicrobia bacterium]|nr:PorV/PorQ family protein [Elusimicrobiota bacterium]